MCCRAKSGRREGLFPFPLYFLLHFGGSFFSWEVSSRFHVTPQPLPTSYAVFFLATFPPSFMTKEGGAAAAGRGGKSWKEKRVGRERKRGEETVNVEKGEKTAGKQAVGRSVGAAVKDKDWESPNIFSESFLSCFPYNIGFISIKPRFTTLAMVIPVPSPYLPPPSQNNTEGGKHPGGERGAEEGAKRKRGLLPPERQKVAGSKNELPTPYEKATFVPYTLFFVGLTCLSLGRFVTTIDWTSINVGKTSRNVVSCCFDWSTYFLFRLHPLRGRREPKVLREERPPVQRPGDGKLHGGMHRSSKTFFSR